MPVTPYTSGTAKALATTGTIPINMEQYDVLTITPTAACTFVATGGSTGKRVDFIITTSGTSTYTLTWSTGFKTTGTLATGAADAKVFVVSFVCKDGTTWVERCRTAAM